MNHRSDCRVSVSHAWKSHKPFRAAFPWRLPTNRMNAIPGMECAVILEGSSGVVNLNAYLRGVSWNARREQISPSHWSREQGRIAVPWASVQIVSPNVEMASCDHHPAPIESEAKGTTG